MKVRNGLIGMAEQTLACLDRLVEIDFEVDWDTIYELEQSSNTIHSTQYH